MTGRQRGQALVAVMVVMLILFALAGAVAIGASTLLSRRNSSGQTNDDFRVRSAVNDSVAQVAVPARVCGAAPPPSPPPTTSSPTATPLGLRLPPPDDQAQLKTLCARMDGVAIDGVERLPVPPGQNGTACRTIDLGKKGRVAVLFDVNVHQGGDAWAFLDADDDTLHGQCPTSLTGIVPKNSPCGSPTLSGGWTQVALTCDIGTDHTAQLHIRASNSSLVQVFAAVQSPQDVSGLGSAYLLAVQTPVASSAMEEALMFVGNDGSTRRLLYEAPLQP
jgi:hypothetical protein